MDSPPAPSRGWKPEDVLYVVFRHKWMIALISAAAVFGAWCLQHFAPVMYESQARLYIRYVLETKTPSPGAETDSRIKSPDMRGASLLDTEQEILTSTDLAQEVADAIGPARILGDAGQTNRYRAALVIQKNLVTDVARNSSVIRLIFHHRDREVAQTVLNQLIASYFKKHAEIHAVGAFDDFLMQETDRRRAQLVQTEKELREARNRAGVISLVDSKKAFTELLARIRQEIGDAEAELAEAEGVASALTNLAAAPTVPRTDRAAATNESQLASNPSWLAEYRRVCSLLEVLGKREQDCLLSFTRESSVVKEIGRQIAEGEDVKRQLEAKHPELTAPMNLVGVSDAKAMSPGWPRDRGAELVRVTALQAKIKVLTNQLNKICEEARAADAAEPSLKELQWKMDVAESRYKRFSESLEQSRLDEKLGAGKVSNISTIQAPSPPVPVASKLRKKMIAVVLGGFAGALALAFTIELYLDRTIKRPVDVKSKLGVPLFMDIPKLDLKEPPSGLPDSRRFRGLLTTGAAEAAYVPTGAGDRAQVDHWEPELADPFSPAAAAELPPWDPAFRLRPFHDALRDRLITYFEVNNFAHKPKLVAVTSCGKGSGVTTVVAGLAASLSETGDGNVLLADLNAPNSAARQFFRGRLAFGLDEALQCDKRSQTLVQDHLYVVAESTEEDQRFSALPNRFKDLVPRMRASDYDYILFDLPPITQPSVVSRLARFMDMVLVVVESEKTSREAAQAATALLVESKAHVAVVLNKSTEYLPRFLRS